MKKLFFLLLLSLQFESVFAQRIFKFSVESTGQMRGGNLQGARDDGNITATKYGVFNTGGTDNFIALSDMYKTWNDGRTMQYLGVPAWSARNAMGFFAVNDTLIAAWGGNGFDEGGNAKQDSWWFYHDTVYSRITSSMTGYSTGHTGAAYAYRNGLFYTAGGNVSTTVDTSNDLIHWGSIATLPAHLQNEGGINMAFWKGYWYIATSQTNTDSLLYYGELYRATPDFSSFELILTDSMFQTKWYTLAATTEALFLIVGHNQYRGGNQKGIYYCEDNPASKDEWKRTNTQYPASHATPACPSWDGHKVYFCGGNMWNLFGMVRCLTK